VLHPLRPLIPLLLALATGAVAVPAAAHAQSASFLRDCREWIDKKGYSTDYIEQKTGKRQPGMASGWTGNVATGDVRAGDVALIRIRGTDAQHAAYVEEVRKSTDGTTSLRLSEWNWGPMTNQRCLVTENFGKLASGRWVALEAVAQVWRPSLAQ
jgi:hypothetical protein